MSYSLRFRRELSPTWNAMRAGTMTGARGSALSSFTNLELHLIELCGNQSRWQRMQPGFVPFGCIGSHMLLGGGVLPARRYGSSRSN